MIMNKIKGRYELNILNKKKKPGRPKLSRDLLRTKKIVTSFTVSEFKKIDKASGNFDISEFSRDLILKGVSKKLRGVK